MHCGNTISMYSQDAAGLRKFLADRVILVFNGKTASRSLRRALLTPQVKAGSLYRCGKRT